MNQRQLAILIGFLALGIVLWLVTRGEAPDTGPEPPVAEGTGPAVVATSTSGGSSGGTGGTTMLDPFGTDDWADPFVETEGVATVGMTAETEGGGTGEAEVPQYAGPCYVRWSKGPVLRFKYDDDGGGGWLRIDGDNDGNLDVCARFWIKDDRTHKVTVDEGCDRKTDATITPTYDDAANLATATWTDQREGGSTEHEITLITLPAFTGIAPGYPLYAARDDIELTIEDGLVREAKVAAATEGPAVKVTLKYDDEGRVTRIDEDHEADGKVERRYDYKYDEVGNVTGITLTQNEPDEDGKRSKSKKSARLGYSCWATAAEPAAP